MNYFYSYRSDIGISKPTNQDTLLVKEGKWENDEFRIYMVCDGMGGYSKGEVASAHVVRSFSKWFEQELITVWRRYKEDNIALYIEESMVTLLQQLSSSIEKYGVEHDIRLGTTATIMLVINDVYYIVHVGDCRIYQIGDALKLFTEDHSLVAKEVSEGRLLPEEMELDPRRNILLQSIGGKRTIEPQFITGEIEKDKTYMICSDGFRHELSEKEVFEKFHPNNITNKDRLHAVCVELVELVKARNEKDNITVLAIRTY